MKPFTIAAVQATPAFLDREATIAKASRLIEEAAGNGARLVVFPEAFVPAYPDWLWAIPPGQGQKQSELYSHLLDQSVTIPSPATDMLCQVAREVNVYVAIGVNERNAEASNGSLYCTFLYIGADGQILGKHRKLVPTAAERLAWAQGDGSTLDVFDTELGKIGGLICYENYMPLARYALYAAGIQVYLAPTWDRGDMWIATLRHIAREGGAYVVGCSMPLRKSDIPESLELQEIYKSETEDWINGGDSAIIDPGGQVIAGPLHNEEGILYAQVDPDKLRSQKWMLDCAGHYARPDVFELTVRRSSHPILRTDSAPLADTLVDTSSSHE